MSYNLHQSNGRVSRREGAVSPGHAYLPVVPPQLVVVELLVVSHLSSLLPGLSISDCQQTNIAQYLYSPALSPLTLLTKYFAITERLACSIILS